MRWDLYMYVYMYDVVIPLIMIIACLYLEMMNCTCWVKYAKWRIRWVIFSLIDVDKWWACVDDLIRDWICLLCYVSDVIAWGVWNER